METFKHLSVDDAPTLLADQRTVIVDVRDAESFRNGHISGAQHLDNDGIADFIQAREFDDPIIVCCYHGNMSQSAATFLIEQGFDEVYSLDGGFEAWANRHPDNVDRLT